MSTPFGALKLDPLFLAKDLPGIGDRSNRWQIVSAFLKTSEGRAERLVENRKGILILVAVPDRPHSGAIYLYSDRTRSFYMLGFNREDDFSAAEFETILQSYNLEQYISQGVPSECRPPERWRHTAHHRPRRNWYRGGQKKTALATVRVPGVS